jgi:hypothetical protein
MTVAQWNVSQNQFPANVQTKDVGNVSAAVLDAIVRALQLDDWVTPCIPTATSLTATPRSPDLGDLKAKPTDRAQAQNGGSARSRPAFFSCWARHWRRRTQVLGIFKPLVDLCPGRAMSTFTAGAERHLRLCCAGELLWQIRDDDHPPVIGGQRLGVLAVAGHGGEPRGEEPVP